VVKKPLRILQVSTFDIHGGAEKIAWNLFDAYRARDYSSWLAVGQKRSQDPDVLLIPNSQSRGRWAHFWDLIASRMGPPMKSRHVSTLIRRMAIALAEPGRTIDSLRGLEDFRFPGTSRLLTLTSQPPQILHCHNLHASYFDLRMLPHFSQQIPAILTLHDAWLLAGHCSHSFACERWKTGCGDCPDLTIPPSIRRDATAYNWRRKREIFARSRLYVATPSHWLMKKVEESILAAGIADARVVPNGVDLRIFHPTDMQTARAVLGISREDKVLLTTGVLMHKNRWKDYPTLRHAAILAAKQMPEQDLLLIILGEDAPSEHIDRLVIRYIPYQNDPRTVANYYQAADIYVHVARADTFPISILEAMACATPVVATAVGGIPEQVQDTHTGFLVQMGDAQELAIRITQLLSNESMKRDMGLRAMEKAQRHYNFEAQVDAYLSWYEELLNERAQ
jgi:glycosyltransferase involved in cell wall biosynthesis